MLISNTRSLIVGSIAICTVWLISVFIAEEIFRLLGDKPSGDLKGLFIEFGDRSYRLAPNVLTGANWASGEFEVATDDLGLRCDTAGRYSIGPQTVVDFLFMGDSQGFGNGVNFEDTIPGVAAELAAKQNLRTANTSVGGHGAMNQVEVVNELQNKYGLNAKSYVVLLTPGMTMYGSGYNRASVGSDGKLYGKETTRFEQGWIFLKQNAVSYSRLRTAIRNVGIGAEPSAEAPFILQVYAKDFKEREARANLTSFLEAVRRLGKGTQAPVSVAYVPLTVEVDFAGVEAAAQARGMTADRNLPLNLARDVSRELGLPFINLRPVLEAEAAKENALHLKGDYHYNSKLSKACGIELWRHLAQQANLAQ